METDELKIIDWDVSSRSKSCLQREGYTYVKEIVFLSDVELKKIANINETCVTEIRLAIKRYLIDIWNSIEGASDTDSIDIYTYYLTDENYIEYKTCKKGAVIKNVSVTKKPNHLANCICIIPEKIGDFPVVGIEENSLNELRANGVKNIIVPNTLKELGNKDKELYDSFERKKYPGKSRLKIWFSIKKYSLMNNYVDIEKGLFVFAEKIDDFLSIKDYVLLNKCQQQNGYWIYPGDGKWIDENENQFLRYTGNQLRVTVETEKVASYAFCESNLEEIIFSDRTKCFSNQMVSECNALEKISFEATGLCKFEQDSIAGCKNLINIDLPTGYDCDGPIIKNCEQLSCVVGNGTLAYYKSSEKVIVVDEHIKNIANGAFSECHEAQVVYIPDCVEYVLPNAFIGTSIHSVVFLGMTVWDISLELFRKMYVYSSKGSPVFKSALDAYHYPARHIYSEYTNGNISVYQKNIERLRNAIEPIFDNEKILDICINNMDEKNDIKVASLPYKWTGYEP